MDEFNVSQEYAILVFDVCRAALLLPFQVHRLQVFVEAGLIAFLNACFEFADEGPEEAQHGSLANLRRFVPAIFTSFRRLLLWGSTRRRLLISSLCCHAAFISASTPGPARQPCAPRGRLEHGTSSAAVESMTSAISVAMSLVQVPLEKAWGRMFEELIDESDSKMDELAGEMRDIEQRLASLEHHARQPRLAMEADVPADKKTRERTEGAATAVEAKHGETCSANRVGPDSMCLTSFDDDSTGPPALPCPRDDALVGNGAAAPKSCLSPLEMRLPIASGGLLPAGKAPTMTRIAFYQPRLRFCPTE